MEKLTALLIILFLLSGCFSESRPACSNADKVQIRNGITYIQNETESFTGNLCRYHSDGHIASESSFDDGKKDGKSISWDVDGVKFLEGNYKNGIEVGEHLEYRSNGTIRFLSFYDDNGVQVKLTRYDESERKEWSFEGTYGGKYGVTRKDGKYIEWDKSGKQSLEIDYKNGKLVY